MFFNFTAKKEVKEPVKKNDTIWVLTIFFSPYKASENSVDNRSFVSKELAEGAMKREAWRLYKSSIAIVTE